MKTKIFSSCVVISKVFILSFLGTCSGQCQCNPIIGSLTSSEISNYSAPAFSKSNHSIKHNINILYSDLCHSNNTKMRLDKVFGVECLIFEEHLKHQDLTIIPGMREDDDFENWSPPPELHRDIPSYLSGFDYQNRPIWIIEFGKWRFDKYVTKDKKKVALFEKYMRYLTYTILKSQALRSTKERRVTEYVTLTDYEGYSPVYLLNREIIQFQLKQVASNYRRFTEKYAAHSILINVNPVVEVFLNLIVPFYSRLLEKIEVYGTNKNVWAPQLLKSFPKEQIPEWYGGNKGYLPFHTFTKLSTVHAKD